MINNLKLALIGFCLVLLVACGGGGGSSSSALTVNTFASDDMNAGFDHVWVTIKKIDLNTISGSVTIFDETATGGKLVDLRTLRDSTGARFVMLSTVSVPAGSYTGSTVTVDKNLSIVTTGSSTATSAVFAGSGVTDKTFSTTFRTPISSSSQRDLVLDFDLSDWTLSGGVVSATGEGFCKHGQNNGLDDSSRHEHEDYHGVVSALTGTAPTQTFTITRNGRSINVATDASTVVFNNDGTANPALANDLRVEVTGSFDTTTGVLNASRVKIEHENESEDDDKIEGLVTEFDATAYTLTAKIHRARGFVPGGTTMAVSVDDNTRYFGDSGIQLTKDEFFALLVSNTTKVEAKGTATTNTTLLARRLKLETEDDNGGGGGGGHHHEAELKGSVSLLNTDAKTFDLTISSWEGVQLRNGQVIHVTATSLPLGLANGNHVEAKGDFNLDTLTLAARSVRRDDN